MCLNTAQESVARKTVNIQEAKKWKKRKGIKNKITILCFLYTWLNCYTVAMAIFKPFAISARTNVMTICAYYV